VSKTRIGLELHQREQDLGQMDLVAELPNVQKAYQDYHKPGFEVVGISLEDAEFQPKATPAQNAAKLALARKGLAKFIAKRTMPWPQYCDGKGWKNELATKYAIYSIPAMFLVDQEGRIVTTAAHGEELDRAARRLLTLEKPH